MITIAFKEVTELRTELRNVKKLLTIPSGEGSISHDNNKISSFSEQIETLSTSESTSITPAKNKQFLSIDYLCCWKKNIRDEQIQNENIEKISSASNHSIAEIQKPTHEPKESLTPSEENFPAANFSSPDKSWLDFPSSKEQESNTIKLSEENLDWTWLRSGESW